MKEGIPVEPVIVGFCGTDHELMMGKRGQLGPKFPEGTDRLINGHEGVVWVPSHNRFAIVLIRGGDSIDPTRYTEDESYFEYGCDRADSPYDRIVELIDRKEFAANPIGAYENRIYCKNAPMKTAVIWNRDKTIHNIHPGCPGAERS